MLPIANMAKSCRSALTHPLLTLHNSLGRYLSMAKLTKKVDNAVLPAICVKHLFINMYKTADDQGALFKPLAFPCRPISSQAAAWAAYT
jgi:hypothetical protein